MLLRDARLFGEGTKARFNVIWMGFLLIPVGFFMRKSWYTAASIFVLIVGLVVVPGLVGLTAAPLWEWSAGLTGSLIGLLVRKVSLDGRI